MQVSIDANTSNLAAHGVETESPAMEDDSVSDSLLSDLRLIPLSSIAKQEGVEKLRSESVAREIKRDGILRHPIYITQLDSKIYTSFDGHNRIDAFNQLGYLAILGQIIPSKEIIPGTWLQVAETSPRSFSESLKRQGFSIKPIPTHQANIDQRDLVATVFSKNTCFTIHNDSPPEIIKDTSRVVQTLAGITFSRIERFSDAETLRVLKRLDDRVVVRFPTFTPQQVIEAVRRGERVGAGVTRWEFRDRLININMPLGAWLNRPLDELNSKLRAAIASGRTRPYCSHITEAEVNWDVCLR